MYMLGSDANVNYALFTKSCTLQVGQQCGKVLLSVSEPYIWIHIQLRNRFVGNMPIFISDRAFD